MIKVTRKTKNPDTDCVFGVLEIPGFSCVTLERLSTLFPAGTYDVTLDFSPHLKYDCPHLKVPSRDEAAGGDAGIRIHIANFPRQLEGCIAVGVSQNSDSINLSSLAFKQMLEKLSFPTQIVVSEAYE